MTVDLDEAQALINRLPGTREIVIKRGKCDNAERVKDIGNPGGIAVNNLTGAEVATARYKIHYSRYGAHVVPDYPRGGDDDQ